MSAHIHCFMSVAGPSDVMADFHTTLMRARRRWPEKGWHWGFGLCDPHGIEPIINDPKVDVKNRPPGESYMMTTGIWLGRDWSEDNVGLAMNTLSSLWPDLTLFFDGHPYEDYVGIRGLWTNGECIVFDLRIDDDYADCDEEGNYLNFCRQVHPSQSRQIPPFYQREFTKDGWFPTWEELRQSIVGDDLGTSLSG